MKAIVIANYGGQRRIKEMPSKNPKAKSNK